MFNYRKTLYQNYYSNHAGKQNIELQKKHFDQQKRYFGKEFIKYLPADKEISILDIGCGSGSLLKAFEDKNYKNTQGIDLSEEQIKMGKQFGVSNLTCITAEDFFNTNEIKFDVITAVDLLEHLSKDEAVLFLSLVKKALKPKGMLIVRCPNMDAPMASAFAHADFTHELFLNKNSLSQLFKSIGFKQTNVFAGYMFIENPIKEIIRKLLWIGLKFWYKLQLFATARTWHDIEFTPNIVIIGKMGE